MYSFDELSEREVLALAISLEEEDARIYGDFADGLRDQYPEQARREKKNIGQVVITNRVGIGPIGGGRMGLAVEMHIHIPGVEHAEAEALVQLADEICPYSNATRGNISVQLIVEDREETLSISRGVER